MKSNGSTVNLPLKLSDLSTGEESGILGVAVNAWISRGTPVAKAAFWPDTDAEERKPGEQTGLDTPVVLAVNDGH